MIYPTILDFYVYGTPILFTYLLAIANKMHIHLILQENRKFIMENYYT